MSEPVTRAEFGMLAAEVRENARRLENIDNTGTRGVGALSVQMTEVIKDVADVRKELGDFRRDHELQHQREAIARSTTRRWAWGFAVTGAASMATVIGLLLEIAAHVH